MKTMTNRTESENHLLDVLDRLYHMGIKERDVRLEEAINAVLQEARQDCYRFDFHSSNGLRLYTPSELLLWFVPATGDTGTKVFVVDLSEGPLFP
jgi:hypothetical protein